MKSLNRLALACALALSSPFVLPATHADAITVQYKPVFRLHAWFETDGSLQIAAKVYKLDANSPLIGNFEKGDEIVAVNDSSTPTLAAFMEAVNQLPPNTMVHFSVQRGANVFPLDAFVP